MGNQGDEYIYPFMPKEKVDKYLTKNFSPIKDKLEMFYKRNIQPLFSRKKNIESKI